MRDSHRGHAIDRSVLDSSIRHSGTGGSGSLLGECAGYEEFTGAEDGCTGKSVADEAAHLRLIAQFVSAVTGSPHPADVLAATARSGAGAWGACPADAEGADTDEHPAGQYDQRHQRCDGAGHYSAATSIVFRMPN